MKITRRQLRKIIQESIVQEGLWDSLKSGYQKAKDFAGDVFDFASDADFKEWGTEDAVALYDAMDGLGTKDDVVQEVIAKRIDDLDVLYKEYSILLQKYIDFLLDVDLQKGISRLVTLGGKYAYEILESIQNNEDLIDWLEDDGLDEEAELVQAALDAKNMQRIRPSY
tara:strand:+ start:45 stop:548 length:504 start_codon:yes stop_codon:yes gene_type:complete